MSTTRGGLGVALAVVIVGVSGGGGGNKTSSGFKVQTGGTGANGGPQSGVGAAGASARTTFLLSKGQGGFPNGPSRNAAVSHDQRVARYIAYESDASNIVDGDANGTTDVFLVIRSKPFGTRGTPWQP